MRYSVAFGLAAVLLAGCADDIQVKDGFGTSALKPVGDIPPEFAEFNNYDPNVNALLADQICARPYIHFDEKNLPAEPGELNVWRGRCKPYVITVESLPDTLLAP